MATATFILIDLRCGKLGSKKTWPRRSQKSMVSLVVTHYQLLNLAVYSGMCTCVLKKVWNWHHPDLDHFLILSFLLKFATTSCESYSNLSSVRRLLILLSCNLDGCAQEHAVAPWVKCNPSIVFELISYGIKYYHEKHGKVHYTRFTLSAAYDPRDDDDNLDYGYEDTYAASKYRVQQEYQYLLFPGRESLSHLTLDAYKRGVSLGPMKYWVWLPWLRKASQVSASFRDAICDIFWANIMIDIEHHK